MPGQAVVKTEGPDAPAPDDAARFAERVVRAENLVCMAQLQGFFLDCHRRGLDAAGAVRTGAERTPRAFSSLGRAVARICALLAFVRFMFPRMGRLSGVSGEKRDSD